MIERGLLQDAKEAAEAAKLEPLPQLELLCAGLAAPHDLSLAALRKYLWRRLDDLAIAYRVLKPSAPARRPVIAPPAAP